MPRLRVLTALLALAAPDAAASEPRALTPSAALAPAPWAEAAFEAAVAVDRGFEGDLAAYASDPYLGHRWGYNDDVPMYLASGVKIAFMVEVFRQREAGTLRFEETLEYTEDDLRDGAPRVNRQRLGRRFEIATLLDWMMRSSDNAASDMLARRVGLRAVDRGLQAEGVYGFAPLTLLVDVRRGFYRALDVAADDLTPRQIRAIRWTDIWTPQIRRLERELGRPPGTFSRQDLFDAYDRYYATGVNHAPMRSVGRLFERLLSGELVSPRASRDMLDLMMGARTSTHRILGRLPPGIRVAHKTGSQFRKVCDLGVVFLPDGHPLVLTACTSGGGVREAEDAIARVARAVYDEVTRAHAAKDPR